MQLPILYARSLESDAKFAGLLFMGDGLNPKIPAKLQASLKKIFRDRRDLANSDEAAWAEVLEDLAFPGIELDGCQIFVRLRGTTPNPRVAAFLRMADDDPEHWWLDYGMSLPEDSLVPEPAWTELVYLKRELEKASALYFRQHVSFYQGESGVYMRVLLDLGDRPLEILLYEEGYLVLESPIHSNFPDTRRARNYVLENLAYRYAQYNLRVDGGSILVVRVSGRLAVEGLAKSLGVFIQDTTQAVAELKKFLSSPPKKRETTFTTTSPASMLRSWPGALH